MLHASWNMGYLIGLWITIILAGISWIVAIAGLIFGIATKGETGVGACLIGAACGIIIGIIGTVVAFPFSGAYHRYVPISGTVTQSVSNRFLGDGNGGTNENFLVTINGNPYRCDDTRCSDLHKGSKVTLLCTYSFQFNAVSGRVCNWGKLGLNN